MPTSSWQPIATGALETRVRAALGEYADVIAAADVPAPDAGAVALWWAYAGDRYGSDARREQAVDRLCEAINEVEGMALHGGVVGLAWTLAHVADETADELLGEFDELVIAAIDPTREWDLIEGLAGVGLYFVERPASATRSLAFERIVDALSRSELRAGAVWRDRQGRLDCGLAHGAAGVIAALSRFRDAPADLAGAADWLVAQRLPDGHMPSFAGGTAARTAWCYGDPGVSLGLRRVAPARARELALAAATRDVADAGVKDAGLCHGAFGLAHIFQRWHQVTDDPVFADAARTWLERGLDMSRPSGTSLLEGAPGAGLALIAAISDEDPGWGRIMAFDL